MMSLKLLLYSGRDILLEMLELTGCHISGAVYCTNWIKSDLLQNPQKPFLVKSNLPASDPDQGALSALFVVPHKDKWIIHFSYLVFFVAAEISYAVLFKQLVIIFLCKFFFPETELVQILGKETRDVTFTVLIFCGKRNNNRRGIDRNKQRVW